VTTSTIVLIACLLAVFGAGSAGAQTTRPSTTDTKRPAATDTKSDTKNDNAQRQTWSPDSTALESSDLVGAKVQTSDGQSIGEINRLILGQRDAKITHVVVNQGGVLGVGATRLVLQWSDIKIQHDPDHPGRWIAVVDQAKLDAAPLYEARKDGEPPAASPSTVPPAPKAKTPATKKY